MHKLEELSINNCKIGQIKESDFSDMNKIRKLKIRTLNIQQSLDVNPNAFETLKHLQVLELSANNIRELPDNFLCTLSGLKVLNLTENRLKTLNNLSVNCMESSELEIFQFKPATNLYATQQFENYWSHSFSGLTSLKILNVSNNQLEMLTGDVFKNNKNLKEIHLQNNNLFDLPEGIFHGLEQLLIIDLSENQLTSHHINSSTFLGLIRLVVLDMGNNALTRIDKDTFKDLSFLQILDLSNNSIGHIESGTFLPLFNLHTLNLAENRLHILNNEMFNGLHVLSKLTLSNNLITAIESQVFHNCSDLKDLSLASNQLNEVPLAVQDLKLLKTLDLGENQIATIANGTFKNLDNLTGLRLIDNHLVNITVGMFANLPNLNVLNLAKNRIRSIERGAFDENIRIEAIRLDKNFLSDIDGIFATLTSLLWLNLSENHLDWFDFAFIPENLKWLDIHGNYINVLDASHNRIAEIGPMSIPNTIEVLFINNNMISTIAPNTFVNKVKLGRVDLYANLLSKIQLNSLRVAPVLNDEHTPEFYLAGNPFECDCSMDWLLYINNSTSQSTTTIQQQLPQIIDIENVECLMPHSRSSPVRQLTTLKPSDFVCKYDRHCPTTCHCCDIDNCDCEMVCPTNCSCYHDSTWSTNIVDCGKQGLKQLPSNIPSDVTDLYLDGNNFVNIKSSDFSFARNMKSLYLNSSNVERIANQTFTKLFTLENLHLENNKLESLQSSDFLYLSSLKELYLHNNHMTDIAFADALKHQMQHITLGRNTWNCNCQNLEMLMAFIAQNKNSILDYNEIIATITMKCNNFLHVGSGGSATMPSEYLPILAVVLVLIFLVVILIIVFLFKDSVRMCLFSRYASRNCNAATKYNSTAEDTGKLYDGIIFHSSNDYSFVLDNLATELEQLGRPGLKLCIPQRDLQQQQPEQPEQQPLSHHQLVELTRVSTKIVLVLTKNFLQNEWSREEYRRKFHDLLRLNGNTNKLVIIEENDVTTDAEFDAELMPYLKLVPSVRILTCDPYFWQKLRYALPSNPRCFRGNQYTIDFPPMHPHEEYKHSSSLYYEDEIDGTYSSGGSMGTNPKSLLGRPTHRTNEMLLRPPSDHIYSSIGSEYHAYDYTDRFSMMQTATNQLCHNKCKEARIITQTKYEV
uniref:TIR domain-containing protein n=1 Tax=Megaselia scalaris TaxID=36166 RepID=T1GD01_MEGSC